MSKYQNVSVNISEGQKDKIKRALQAGAEVSIRLSHEDFNGDHVLALTNAQINKMRKAYESRTGVTLKLSKTQLKYNATVEGGFIGALLPMLATAGKFILSKILPSLATGALAGVGTAVGSKVVDKISGGKIYVNRRGESFKIEPYGRGLYLSPWAAPSTEGDGLYLKRGDGLYLKTGKGLILGENSPFKNIPILGWIL